MRSWKKKRKKIVRFSEGTFTVLSLVITTSSVKRRQRRPSSTMQWKIVSWIRFFFPPAMRPRSINTCKGHKGQRNEHVFSFIYQSPSNRRIRRFNLSSRSLVDTPMCNLGVTDAFLLLNIFNDPTTKGEKADRSSEDSQSGWPQRVSFYWFSSEMSVGYPGIKNVLLFLQIFGGWIPEKRERDVSTTLMRNSLTAMDIVLLIFK